MRGATSPRWRERRSRAFASSSLRATSLSSIVRSATCHLGCVQRQRDGPRWAPPIFERSPRFARGQRCFSSRCVTQADTCARKRSAARHGGRWFRDRLALAANERLGNAGSRARALRASRATHDRTRSRSANRSTDPRRDATLEPRWLELRRDRIAASRPAVSGRLVAALDSPDRFVRRSVYRRLFEHGLFSAANDGPYRSTSRAPHSRAELVAASLRDREAAIRSWASRWLISAGEQLTKTGCAQPDCRAS